MIGHSPTLTETLADACAAIPIFFVVLLVLGAELSRPHIERAWRRLPWKA